jgi:hypothetical protein
MKCEEANELFSDYIANEMEVALRVSLENHIEACADCKTALHQLRSLWNDLDNLEDFELPAGAHDTLIKNVFSQLDAAEHLEATRKAEWNWRKAFQPRVLAYAASVAAILLLSAGGLHYSKASLDPIQVVINLLHPTHVAPAGMSEARAEWSQDADGTGTLIVHLQARSASIAQRCTINLPSGLAKTGAVTTVDMPVSGGTVLYIPLNAAPPTSGVTITSAPTNSAGGSAVTQPVNVMLPLAPGS